MIFDSKPLTGMPLLEITFGLLVTPTFDLLVWRSKGQGVVVIARPNHVISSRGIPANGLLSKII